MDNTNLLGEEISVSGDINQVETSILEKTLVNLFTPLDVLADYVRDQREEPILERAKRMWQGKITDYKRFCLIYEENDNQLPSKVKKLLKYSPCGWTKRTALYLRNP